MSLACFWNLWNTCLIVDTASWPLVNRKLIGISIVIPSSVELDSTTARARHAVNNPHHVFISEPNSSVTHQHTQGHPRDLYRESSGQNRPQIGRRVEGLRAAARRLEEQAARRPVSLWPPSREGVCAGRSPGPWGREWVSAVALKKGEIVCVQIIFWFFIFKKGRKRLSLSVLELCYYIFFVRVGEYSKSV